MATSPYSADDSQIELQKIDRQRKMADMLRQQSMTPAQGGMVGNRYVGSGFLQNLATVLQGYKARQGDEQADQAQLALGKKMQARNQSDMSGVISALRGTPATSTPPLTPNDDEGNLMPNADVAAVPPDRNKALTLALGSQNPMLQQFGGAALKDAFANPESSFGKVDPKDFTQESVAKFAQSGKHSDLVPVRANVNVNGTMVNPFGVEGKVIPKQAPAVNPAADLLVPGPDGKLIPNAQLVGVKKDIAQAGKSSTNNTIINAGEKEFSKETGKLDAKELADLRGKAQAATNSLETVKNLRAAVDQGVYSGGGAGVKTAAANIINGITGLTPKELPGSQLFNAEASKLVLDHVKALGANPSNADRVFIEKTVPMLATSPPARDALINWIEQKATQTIGNYKSADAYARKNHGLGGFEAPGSGRFKIIGVSGN